MLAALLLAPVFAIPSATAGTETGEVVFRLTLRGAVDPADAFKLVVDCRDHHYCGEVGNFVCAPPRSDTLVCEAKTYEVVLGIGPQSIDYALHMTRDLVSFDGREAEEDLLLSGSWDVHAGRQVISLGYVYPGGASGGPSLPDTAMGPP
jgi:hypothetical protein